MDQTKGCSLFCSCEVANHFDHGECVFCTVISERLRYFSHPRLGSDRRNCLEVGKLRRGTIRDIQRGVVAAIADGRQNGLDGPAAALITVVPVLASNRQKINNARCDRLEIVSEIRKPLRQPEDACPLEGCIVRDDGPILWDLGHQCLGAGAARIFAIQAQKFTMGDLPFAIFDVG